MSRDGAVAPMPLFDRLVDLEPHARLEAAPLRTLDLPGLRESVRRELAHLLSTRTPLSLDELATARDDGRERTVVDYGLPALVSFSAAHPEDRLLLAAAVRAAVEAFEPRLREIRVRFAEPGEAEAAAHAARRRAPGRFDADAFEAGTARLVIEARLVTEHVDEPLSFDLALGGVDPGITTRSEAER